MATLTVLLLYSFAYILLTHGRILPSSEITHAAARKSLLFEHGRTASEAPSVDKVAFIIQGRAETFAVWRDLHRNMMANASVDIYYGAYDAPVASDDCKGGEGIASSYICLFLPKTSWSTGRNELARTVFRKGDNSYKYWIFMDEDAREVICIQCEAADHPHSCCFDVYVRYLLLDAVQHAIVGLFAWQTPKHTVEAHAHPLPNGTVVQVPLIRYHGPAYSQLFWDCIDARINAFHVDVVPLVLPYFTQLENVSWWESQALQFYFTQGCIPGSTIVLGGFDDENTERKPYPRGRVPTARELEILLQEVPTLYPALPVPNNKEHGFGQGNCGNRTVKGWQPLGYVYGHRPDSGWWRQSMRFQLCMGSMRERFLAFMQAPSPYLDDMSAVHQQ